jgi:hypothetical protein
MPITNTTSATGVEQEAEKSSSDRQRVVSWAYPDWKQQAPPLSIIHPKPPHYHDSLSNELHIHLISDSFGAHAEQCSNETCREEEDTVLDAELNVGVLVGAKCAEDTLKSYEIDVGFYYTEPDSPFQPEDRSLCRVITDYDIAVGKERWADLVQMLAGKPLDPRLRHDSGGQG